MRKAILIVDIDDKYSNAIDELRADININCYGEEILCLKNETLKEMPYVKDFDEKNELCQKCDNCYYCSDCEDYHCYEILFGKGKCNYYELLFDEILGEKDNDN